MKKAAILTVVLGLAVAGPAYSAVFTNGSFEQVNGIPLPATNTFVALFAPSTNLTGWTVAAGAIDLVGTNFVPPDFAASDGNYSLDLNSATVQQSFDTVSGVTYNVSFDLNTNPFDGNGNIGPDRSVLVSAAGNSQTFTYLGALHPKGSGGPWITNLFSFTATGSSTTLAFQSLSQMGSNGAELDNVRVARAAPGAVPETATWTMMILGLGAVGATMRRRRVRVQARFN